MAWRNDPTWTSEVLQALRYAGLILTIIFPGLYWAPWKVGLLLFSICGLEPVVVSIDNKKTTKQVKKQFVDMSAKMEEKMNEQRQQNTAFNTTKATAQPTAKSDDYIDFEEIK